MSEPFLEARGVGRTFRTARGVVSALEGVDLSVAPGELVLVRGPSGAGKTTLLLTLGGMLRPSAGSVRLAGQDLYALPAAARRRLRGTGVGFVFQTMHLLPYLDAQGNVALALPRLPAGEARERARARLQALGLAHRAHHRPAQLSAGECQRVALARALVHGPGLVLADEPTGNLDGASAERVLAELESFRAGSSSAPGGALVLVTHERGLDLDPTRVLELEGGRAVVAAT